METSRIEEVKAPQHFKTPRSRVAEARLFSLLGRERLHGFEVEVVVEVEVVQILPMDQ